MTDVRFESETLAVSGGFDESSDAEEAPVDDRSMSAEDLPCAAELTFEEKLAALNRTVMRHPLNREIL